MLMMRDTISEGPPPLAASLWRARWGLVAIGILLVVAMVGAGLFFSGALRPKTGSLQRSTEIVLPPPLPKVEDPKLIEIAPEAARDLNAKRAFDITQVIPARPFVFDGPPDARERALDCLAAVAWYEAGDNNVMQKSVVQVVLNRARHPAFPASVCGTVFEGSERVTGCQFTFACDGSLRRTPSPTAWARARAVANAALSGTVDPSVGNATHYHADYVVPYWASSLNKMSQVGAHIFYSWKGFWGMPGAFRRHVGASELAYSALGKLSPAHLRPDAVPLPASLTVDPALLPPAVEPPAPIAVEGVREKSLRGALVRGGAGDTNQFFLQLDPATFPGNYATAAVALCKGRPSCVVMGWRDVGQMASKLPLDPAQRSALTFYYEQRENADDRALWNCAQLPRRNTAQCLPAQGMSFDQSQSPPVSKAAQ